MDYAEKMQRCHEYVEALEEEKRKIQVFQRELPLCLELVTQAIEACKKELSGTTTEYNMQEGQTQSECSEEEQISSERGGHVAVLEQFMPLKKSCSSDNDNDNDDDDDDDEEQQSQKHNNNTSDKKKSDWLRSVQLWNQSPDPPSKEDVPRKTAVVMEVKRNGGGFQPFQKEKSIGKVNNNSSVATSSTGGSSGNSQKEEKDGQNQRKQRRCWSPELHRRFLHALQQLGGSHAATPKQIRELMKVDGLTNDEVKSHLQKYRLHTRRPSQTVHNNGNPQGPQFVVVGGIWVPPPEYATVATTTGSGEAASVAAPNGIYAPVAAPPATVPQASSSLVQRLQQAQSENLHSEERGSHSAGDVHSNSPATSSSTHTSTASPVS